MFIEIMNADMATLCDEMSVSSILINQDTYSRQIVPLLLGTVVPQIQTVKYNLQIV